ncbi:MAG: peptide ABC transporter substrate-binding protein [Planctomycetes bacterium]|nr:peptide ABC transporter substrate-binding protein [Planctomycetota bacterium]
MAKRKSLTALFVIMLLVIVSIAGCKKPAPSGSSKDTSYDPAKDPLVNPPQVFQAPPDDLSLINTDETLYLQLDGNPNTLNPLFVSSLYEFTVVDVLYDGLFSFDKDMKWFVNEDMVESIEESDDHTTYIVKIKQGYTWHDGHPWTAHDVVYSWKQILDPQVPCLAQKPSVEPITECIALDDYTVKFVQAEPLATREWNLLFPVIPKHIFEKEKKEHPDLKTGEYYIKQARFPVGSGPYKIVEWKENDKIVVELWDDYKGKKPYFKRIVFKIIPDTNMSLLSFEKGQIDVIRRLTAQQFAKETNSETFKKVGHKLWGTQWALGYIGYNMDGTNPFFADKNVRYAMTHAFNITLFLDKVYYNLATKSVGMYHPESWMYNPEVQPLQYDLEKSKAYLDKAEWFVDPEDGWRYKEIDGNKIRFEFTLLMAQGSSTAPKMAAILQQDLKKIGVDMKTRTLEWSAFLEKIRKHEFQAETAMWGTGTDPDTGWNLWRTDQYEKGRNYGGYSNPRIDELFVLGRKEFDVEKRTKIYQEIHKILYEDQPYTWVFNAPILSAINNRIQGIQFSPRGIFGFDPSFYGWWVPKAPAEMKQQ